MDLELGLTGRASRVVTDADTAIALGSGDVPVLGTPAVLALIEEACCAAVAESLADGATSVGVWVELEHTAPSRIGATVEATATLDSVEGRKLAFTAEVLEGERVVAHAAHRRVVVDRAKFLADQ